MAAKKSLKKVAARAKSTTRNAVKKTGARARSVKRSAKVPPIPKGFHSVTASLVVRGAKDAIEFYKKAFGAKTVGGVMTDPSGKVMHAEIKIGDSIVMLGDEMPEMGAHSPQKLGGSSTTLMIYSRDVDSLFKQAVAAGAKVVMPLEDQFWGDRYGQVSDPYGHSWALATHKEKLSPKEIGKRAAKLFSAPQG